MEPLRIALYFSLLIGPLVFFHELGHLLMAKRFGVKCDEFALGFGPKIASIHGEETEYSFRALPLGGFVRMLGMDDGAGRDDEAGRSLVDKPRWQRLLIFLAGPMMNLLIPIPIFLLFHVMTVEHVPPVVGSVEAGMPADNAGLQPGDRIVEIDGRSIRRFAQLQRRIGKRAGEATPIAVQRGDETIALTITPEPTRMRDPSFPLRTTTRGLIGIQPSSFAAAVNVLGDDSPAAQAGFRPFDRIVRVGDTEVKTFYELESALRRIDEPTEVTLMRGDSAGVDWGRIDIERLVQITVEEPIAVGVESGLVSAQRAIFAVQEGSPADRAGLRRGDQVEAIDGRAFTDLRHAAARLEIEGDEPHTMLVRRGQEQVELTLTPQTMTVTAEFKTEREETFVGLQTFRQFVPPPLEKQSVLKNIGWAIGESIRDTVGVIFSLLLGLGYLFAGQVDSASVGGPMMIADAASQAARNGWQPFINMMALISVNLGVLNLLPIPGLDGGHMAVIGLESVKRGPLSARTRQLIHFAGVAAIVLLMIFVFKNDIERYWSSIANWLNS